MIDIIAPYFCFPSFNNFESFSHLKFTSAKMSEYDVTNTVNTFLFVWKLCFSVDRWPQLTKLASSSKLCQVNNTLWEVIHSPKCLHYRLAAFAQLHDSVDLDVNYAVTTGLLSSVSRNEPLLYLIWFQGKHLCTLDTIRPNNSFWVNLNTVTTLNSCESKYGMIEIGITMSKCNNT